MRNDAQVAFLQVCDMENPVKTSYIRAPVSSIIDKLNDKIEDTVYKEK